MAHLFGPVPSRRLGRSLGVDLIPPKTCPYNCIYCEVGPTTCQTRERFSFQTGNIIQELADHLKAPGVRPDVITLAGSGITVRKFLGGGAPTVGSATIAEGGWATVVKQSSTEVWIQGLDLS